MRRWLAFVTRIGSLVLLGALLGVAILGVVSAHGGDPGSIHACVNIINGQVRIVGATNDCSSFPGGWVPVD